jgi:hypothetical protein
LDGPGWLSPNDLWLKSINSNWPVNSPPEGAFKPKLEEFIDSSRPALSESKGICNALVKLLSREIMPVADVAFNMFRVSEAGPKVSTEFLEPKEDRECGISGSNSADNSVS